MKSNNRKLRTRICDRHSGDYVVILRDTNDGDYLKGKCWKCGFEHVEKRTSNGTDKGKTDWFKGISS